MKMFSKKGLGLIFISLFISANSQLAHAFPEVDPGQLGAEIQKAIQDAMQYLEKSETYNKTLEMAGELKEMFMDSEQNAQANYVARLGAARQALSELNVAQMQEAAANLCGSVSYSLNLSRAGCEDEDEANIESFVYMATSPVFSRDRELAAAEANRLAYEVVSRNPELFLMDPDSAAKVKEEIGEKASVFDMALFTSSSKSLLNLTKDQQEAMKAMIQIVTPNYSGNRPGSDIPNKKETLLMISAELPLLAARQSLLSILQKRSMTEDGKPSNLATYQEIVDAYNDPVAVHGIANGNVSNPVAVRRSQVLVQAHKARVQLDQFKASLRAEAIEALKLIQMQKSL